MIVDVTARVKAGSGNLAERSSANSTAAGPGVPGMPPVKLAQNYLIGQPQARRTLAKAVWRQGRV